MANQRSFGRRVNTQAPRGSVPSNFGVVSQSANAPGEIAASAAAPKTDFLSLESDLAHDDDLEEWKRGRRTNIPWRQLSLMASLCFGIASFVLPGWMNDNVQWLLYALMAASLYAGLSKRWKKAAK